MIGNEWHRSMHLMNLTKGGVDGQGIRLLLTRQQAASYLEAVQWITDSRKRFPEIRTLIANLPPIPGRILTGHWPGSIRSRRIT